MADAVPDRVFTEKELAECGKLTVDLMAQSLSDGDSQQAEKLLARFHLELQTMFYSYTGWETSILECFEALAGEARPAEVLAIIENAEIAPERIVSTEGVAEQWQARIDALSEFIQAGSIEAFAKHGKSLHADALALHDALLSRVNALLSQVYEDHGVDIYQDVLTKVMKPEAMDPNGTLPFREKVENIMLFTRCHMLPFNVVEDDEKVTFMPDPCPSGARLIRDGHYESPRKTAIVQGPNPMTYGRDDLPAYCCHEPAMELGSALKTGVPLFIVDPPEDVGFSPCKIYVYKRASEIPEKFYTRIGLSKPEDLIASSRGNSVKEKHS